MEEQIGREDLIPLSDTQSHFGVKDEPEKELDKDNSDGSASSEHTESDQIISPEKGFQKPPTPKPSRMEVTVLPQPVPP